MRLNHPKATRPGRCTPEHRLLLIDDDGTLLRHSLFHLAPRPPCGLQGAQRLWWSALSEQLGEGGNVGVTGRVKAVRLLKSSQGPLRGGPHFTICNAGIVAGTFQFALQAFNEV